MTSPPGAGKGWGKWMRLGPCHAPPNRSSFSCLSLSTSVLHGIHGHFEAYMNKRSPQNSTLNAGLVLQYPPAGQAGCGLSADAGGASRGLRRRGRVLPGPISCHSPAEWRQPQHHLHSGSLCHSVQICI